MDINAMRKKLAELNAPKGAAVNETLFKPAEGETTIRIVPLAGSPDNPFQELLWHYKVGPKSMLSPLSYGEADPIAQFSDALIGEGGLSKEEWKAAKQFSPQIRTYVPIVVRGKEAEGVKFWAFGKTTYQQILAIIADEDYGDITNPDTGHDIKLIFTPQEKSKTSFATTEIMAKPKPTPLTTDKALRKKLLEEQPKLVDQFKKYSFNELKAALEAHLSPKGEATAPVTEPVKSESPSAQKAAEPATLAPDAEAEFDALFNS